MLVMVMIGMIFVFMLVMVVSRMIAMIINMNLAIEVFRFTPDKGRANSSFNRETASIA